MLAPSRVRLTEPPQAIAPPQDGPPSILGLGLSLRLTFAYPNLGSLLSSRSSLSANPGELVSRKQVEAIEKLEDFHVSLVLLVHDTNSGRDLPDGEERL